jgi:chromate transporter
LTPPRTGPSTPRPSSSLDAALEVFKVALKLGLTSFGGPVAHLGYFRAEYVVRRRWIDDARYVDLVALCQFLPGPASSQVSMAVGITRAGWLGGLAAWLGFTVPSAVALVAFAYGIGAAGVTDAGWLHGLKVVAVAVVAQAVWGMARNLAADRLRASLAIAAAVVAVAARTAAVQLLVIVAAGVAGWWLLRGAGANAGTVSDGRDEAEMTRGTVTPAPIGKGRAIGALALFFALLVGLPVARQVVPGHALAVADSFYRAGSLVFGGGHVVLPLLHAEVVPPGWVTDQQFLAGYGAAQAVPGPLFTFAAYLGAVMHQPPNGWPGAGLALAAVFLPSFLLIAGVLPFWESLRARPSVQAALGGINAAVVGLLLAALYDPVWRSAINGPADFALALVAFGLLAFWQMAPWLVVAISAAGGAALAALG